MTDAPSFTPQPVTLALPEGKDRLLLHVCCAPCSCAIIDDLHRSKINFSIFFYNPNIFPEEEYELRKNEIKRFATELSVPFIDADYDTEIWYQSTWGLENEPERGARCQACFDLRLERVALYAAQNNFPLFSSSLGISRWKNLTQVNASGKRAADLNADVTFWDINWRKDGRQKRAAMITRDQAFHQQVYCGCVHSLRETNERLNQQGLGPAEPGVKRVP